MSLCRNMKQPSVYFKLVMDPKMRDNLNRKPDLMCVEVKNPLIFIKLLYGSPLKEIGSESKNVVDTSNFSTNLNSVIHTANQSQAKYAAYSDMKTN
jgi:hypothetical protein